MDKYILLLVLIQTIYSENSYESLEKWGKEKGVEINDKISMNYISENTNYYYANNDVSEGEIIMSIPYNIFLNLNNTLQLTNKKINNLWLNISQMTFIEIELVHRFNKNRKEETFISYIMWLFITNNKYHKSKFYKFYRNFFSTIRTNYDNCPIFFNEDQKNLFSNTSFGSNIDLLDKYIDDDLESLTAISQKSIEKEEYIKYRLNTLSNSYNILNHSHLIPFTNLFEKNPYDYNLKYQFNKEKMIFEIFSVKKIKKNQNLMLYTIPQSNLYFLLFSGVTYDNNNLIDNFIHPILTPNIVQEYDLNYEEYDFDIRLNITEDKYYEKVLNLYKNISKTIEGKGTDKEAYSILLHILNDYKISYEYTTVADYYRILNQKKDVENAKNVVELEKKILNQKIKELQEVIDDLQENNSNKNNINKKDEQKENDL